MPHEPKPSKYSVAVEDLDEYARRVYQEKTEGVDPALYWVWHDFDDLDEACEFVAANPGAGMVEERINIHSDGLYWDFETKVIHESDRNPDALYRDGASPIEHVEPLSDTVLDPDEILEVAGCPYKKLDHCNSHEDTEDVREYLRPLKLTWIEALAYPYDIFALFDDGRSEGAVWFPVDIRPSSDEG